MNLLIIDLILLYHPLLSRLRIRMGHSPESEIAKDEVVQLGKKYLSFLTFMANHGGWWERNLAVELLGRIHHPSSLPIILIAASDKKEKIRKTALTALRHFDSPNASAAAEQLSKELDTIAKQRGFFIKEAVRLSPDRWIAKALCIAPIDVFAFPILGYIDGDVSQRVSINYADDEERKLYSKTNKDVYLSTSTCDDLKLWISNQNIVIISGEGTDKYLENRPHLLATCYPCVVKEANVIGKMCFTSFTEIPDMIGVNSIFMRKHWRYHPSDRHLRMTDEEYESYTSNYMVLVAQCAISENMLLVFNDSATTAKIQGVLRIDKRLSDSEFILKLYYWTHEDNANTTTIRRELVWHEVNYHDVEITVKKSKDLFEIVNGVLN